MDAMKTYQEIKSQHKLLSERVHELRIRVAFEGHPYINLVEAEQRLQVCSKLLEEALMQPLFKNEDV